MTDFIQALESKLYNWAIAEGYNEKEARKKAKEAARELHEEHEGTKIPLIDDDPEICARAYDLHVCQGIPASAVAERMHITRRTVYRRVQRHLARIRSESELSRVTA